MATAHFSTLVALHLRLMRTYGYVARCGRRYATSLAIDNLSNTIVDQDCRDESSTIMAFDYIVLRSNVFLVDDTGIRCTCAHCKDL